MKKGSGVKGRKDVKKAASNQETNQTKMSQLRDKLQKVAKTQKEQHQAKQN